VLLRHVDRDQLLVTMVKLLGHLLGAAEPGHPGLREWAERIVRLP